MLPTGNEHIEPAPEMLTGDTDPGALAAMDAALSGQPIPEPVVDPQPGDALPPPDSAPAAPEGDGATDPADNAPQPDGDKPDEKKTVEPVDPLADDPAVEPASKRPSDELGELPADAPAKTRERFETMRSKYDEVHTRAEAAEAGERKWIDTVQSTGATPEQFGGALSYLKAVNSGTREGMEQAYEMMSGELATLAKTLGREVPGAYDPLAEHADLSKRVEDGMLEREDALEIAQARAGKRFDTEVNTHVQQQQTVQQQHDMALDAVKNYGAQMKASDPSYNAKAAAIKPMVERVIAQLPPAQWAAAIKDAYEAVTVAAPAPAPTIVSPLRPTASPGGNGVIKEAGNAMEAMDMALANM